ncbi:MAG: CPBP family intramembrane metalloprotease [Prevotella sp.]|nr:CPBP family intramembrane metalloprotease [Prevotella sp.]
MMKNNVNALAAVAYVLIFLAIQVAAQFLMTAIQAIKQGGPVEQLSTVGTMIAMVTFSLVTIILFTLLKWAPVSRHYLMSRPWVVLLWSLFAALGAIIPSMWLQESMPEWPERVQQYIDQAEMVATQLMSTTGGYAVVCLLAPVAEELVFRGAALRSLLLWKPECRWTMIFLSALLFALAHVNPAQFLHPLLIGLLLGWMYERTGSIIPGIVYHWTNNTAAYLLYHAYPSSDITLSDIFGNPMRTGMAVFFSLLILLPAIYQLNQWMKRPAPTGL